MDSSPRQERILTNEYWFTFSFSLKKFSKIFDTRIWNLFGIVRACEWRFSNNHIIITNLRRDCIFARNGLSISRTRMIELLLDFSILAPTFHARVVSLVSCISARFDPSPRSPFHASFPPDKSSVSIRLALKGRYRSRLFSIESFERKREERARPDDGWDFPVISPAFCLAVNYYTTSLSTIINIRG